MGDDPKKKQAKKIFTRESVEFFLKFVIRYSLTSFSFFFSFCRVKVQNKEKRMVRFLSRFAIFSCILQFRCYPFFFFFALCGPMYVEKYRIGVSHQVFVRNITGLNEKQDKKQSNLVDFQGFWIFYRVIFFPFWRGGSPLLK